MCLDVTYTNVEVWLLEHTVVWHHQITQSFHICMRNTRAKVSFTWSFFFFKEIILLHFLLNALFWVRHQQTFLVVLITGFEILAFPCNQFGGQEPGSNPEIKQFACTRFKAEFPIFDKVLLRSLCYSFRLCVLQIRISLNPTGRCEWTEHSTNLSVLEIKRRRILGWSH